MMLYWRPSTVEES
jgi:hypothetical protein